MNIHSKRKVQLCSIKLIFSLFWSLVDMFHPLNRWASGSFVSFVELSLKSALLALAFAGKTSVYLWFLW